MASPIFELLLLSVLAYIAIQIKKGFSNMALNRDALNRGLQAVADNLLALAEAISRPAADLAEAQTALDDTGTKLEAFAAQLGELKTAEDAEDGATPPAPEPTPEG